MAMCECSIRFFLDLHFQRAVKIFITAESRCYWSLQFALSVSHILLACGNFRRDNLLMRVIFRIIVILVLVGIVVGAIVVATSIDGIVKKGVETFGPQITKVSVNLESVHIVLFTGSAKVTGLVVGNPEGYKMPQAISVGLAEVGVNPFSILSDKIVIRTFHVISPEITFEGGLSGNNLGKIMENVNAAAKTSAKHPPPMPPPASQPKKLKWMIFSLRTRRFMSDSRIWAVGK